MRISPKLADSEYGAMRDMLNLETDKLTDAACLFLEGKGLRFCVDYGTENALEIAKSYRGWPLAKFPWAELGRHRKQVIP